MRFLPLEPRQAMWVPYTMFKVLRQESQLFSPLFFFFFPTSHLSNNSPSFFISSLSSQKALFHPFLFCSPLPLSLSFLCITSLLFPPHFSLFIYLFQSYSLLGFSLDLSLSLSLSLSPCFSRILLYNFFFFFVYFFFDK